jgi:hypothetical protein
MDKSNSRSWSSSTQNAHDHKLSRRVNNGPPIKKKTKQANGEEKVGFFIPEEAEKVAVVEL